MESRRFPASRTRARSSGAIGFTSRQPCRHSPARRPSSRAEKAGIDSAKDMVAHTWRLLAFDKTTGKVMWDKVVHQGMPRLKRHVKASHASATPATDGRSIVALLGSEGLFCFDTNGTLKWRQDLGVMDVGLVDDPSYQWGPASSPDDLRQPRHRPERPPQGLVRCRVRPCDGKAGLADGPRRVSVMGNADDRARRIADRGRDQRREVHPRSRSQDRPRALAALRQPDAS